MLEIRWIGNEHTNSGSRNGYVPFVIVDHISDGTMRSMDAWFTDPNNHQSSAHFGVAKDGRIHQYVDIARAAWAQGITAAQIPDAPAKVVRDMGVNPNLYAVSIEHEGTNGDLTEAQFQATVWLHRYIRDYIREKWGKAFPLDEYHVIGHFQVNPVNKPYCPGPLFPWKQLYGTLSAEEGDAQEMDELKKQIEELQSQVNALKKQVDGLQQLHHMEIPDWAKEGVRKAVDQGIVSNPDNGSYDFYRFLTVLNNKGLI